MLATDDLLWLIHPAIAITFVFPLIGIVVYKSLQTRKRRLEVAGGEKSKVPPSVGAEHVQIGRWLSSSVVGITLLGMAHPLLTKKTAQETWAANSGQFIFVLLIFVLSVASLVFLHRAKPKIWRAVFATLTGMGIFILGWQNDLQGKPIVWRRDFEWQVSHFYFGIAAAMLMIFSLATIQDIYKDRMNRWRNAHIILNSIATLLFISVAITGTRDLLEVPLTWQTKYIEQLYINQCQTQPCEIKPAPAPAGEAK